MGYTTTFAGGFDLSRPLTLAEANCWLRNWYGQDPNGFVSEGAPRGFLQWVPSEDLGHVVWDGEEKFYDYAEWLGWLVGRLDKLGIACTGEVRWAGEDRLDTGVLRIADGRVEAVRDVPGTVQRYRPLTKDKLGQMALERVAAGSPE